MSAKWRGTGLALCALVLGLFVLGCGRSPAQVLVRWTLDGPGVAPRPIVFPARLDELPDRVVHYRLRTTVALDGALRGGDVELVLPYLPAPAWLRVDGREALPVGDPAPAALYGGYRPRRWLVPTEAARGAAPLNLELEIEHRWTESARLDVAPELVRAGSPSALADRNEALNVDGAWFGMVALSQVGITFLAVYFWDRRRRAYLWFAIQALTASYYPAYILGLPASVLGWKAEIVLLAQSLAVAPVVSVYFTHDFFHLPRPSRAWLALLAMAMLAPIAVLVRMLAIHSEFAPIEGCSVVVVVCVLSAIVYQLVTGFRLLRSKADRSTVLFFLCCWGALGGSSWIDLLAWGGGPELLGGGRPACAGLGLFGIFTSMLLSRSHSRSLVEADGLNDRLRAQVHDLEARQQEIETLNGELRRQIGRRTADILAALVESDSTHEVNLRPGDVVEGRYRIVASLGVGGMGAVHEVERLSDGRRLALKTTQEVRGLALARLAREARIATKVNHPNVVSVLDADVAEGGYAFLVMELVDGETLADCSKERCAAWRLNVLTQILQGVRALHSAGIIHRDLKPSNVLVANDEGVGAPRVKIADFGISRWLEEDEPLEASLRASEAQRRAATVRLQPALPAPDPTENGQTTHVLSANGHPPASPSTTARRREALRDPRSSPQLTRTGQISGTPAYVAPELADGTRALSPSADVFSFGVLAYSLLTGMQPFAEPPLLARLDRREVPRPKPVSTQCSGIAHDVAIAVDACLAPTAEGRPAVADLLVVFERASSAVAHS